ncbi:MAG TPA: hypothetical protein VFE62_15610 [Gemmataceae bacterium]|nr:hypothetical protein [Gemmataceae bacterium]
MDTIRWPFSSNAEARARPGPVAAISHLGHVVLVNLISIGNGFYQLAIGAHEKNTSAWSAAEADTLIFQFNYSTAENHRNGCPALKPAVPMTAQEGAKWEVTCAGLRLRSLSIAQAEGRSVALQNARTAANSPGTIECPRVRNPCLADVTLNIRA